MNTCWNRVSAIFSFTTTVFGCVLCVIATTSLFVNPDVMPTAEVTGHTLKSLSKGRDSMSSYRVDKADLDFDLDVDFQSEFNWNVKQIFLWVAAEYRDKAGVMNSVSIWDRIIPSIDAAKFTLRNEKPEYPLKDYDLRLRGVEVNFTCYWDVQPHVGFIYRRKSYMSHVGNFPQQYTK